MRVKNWNPGAFGSVFRGWEFGRLFAESSKLRAFQLFSPEPHRRFRSGRIFRRYCQNKPREALRMRQVFTCKLGVFIGRIEVFDGLT
jgi:hypothetical protein